MSAKRNFKRLYLGGVNYLEVSIKESFMLKYSRLIPLLILVSCIGTDKLDDPKDSAIMLDLNPLVLQIGNTHQLEASYWYNMWVEDPSFTLVWKSGDIRIASVNQNGILTAVAKGQTQIEVIAPFEDTLVVMLTVVESIDEVSRVVITGAENSILVGEKIQLNAEAFNLSDVSVQGIDPTFWVSTNPAIAEVDQNGLVTGLADGATFISATIDDVTSAGYPIVVGSLSKIGVFQSANGYNAQGMVTLTTDASGNLILTLSNDFQVSFALGTFLYLANSTSGSTVASQGFEIEEIRSNGPATYNLADYNSSLTIDDYQYVVLLCKPASITFGFAELN
jgi:hypothetical protein